MDLKAHRRIAAQVMKVGVNKVWFDPNRLDEIKEAITKADIRSLVKDLAIQKRPTKGISKFRSRKLKIQKRKGRRAGPGSRQGSKRARLPKKQEWKERIRSQREMLKKLRNNGTITKQTYKEMRRKAKGGFFRSRRHIYIYLTGAGLIKKEDKPKENLTKQNDSSVQKKERRKNGLQ